MEKQDWMGKGRRNEKGSQSGRPVTAGVKHSRGERKTLEMSTDTLSAPKNKQADINLVSSFHFDRLVELITILMHGLWLKR